MTASDVQAGAKRQGVPPSVWIVLAALAVRLAAVGVLHSLPPMAIVGSTAVRPADQPVFPDSVEFLMVSWHIRMGRGPILSADSAVGRMPGYPYFLAGVALVFGDGLLAPRLAQAVLGAASVALVILFTGRLFGRRAGRVAGTIAAVYPMFVLMGVLLLSETLFLLLFLAGLVCVHGAFTRRDLPASIGAGIAFGAATLVRSSLLLFVPFAACAWVLLGRFERGALLRAAAMLAACAAAMSPWVVRNRHVTGRFVPTRLRVGPSLYEALNPEADGGPMMQRIDWGDGTQGLSEYEKDRLWRRRAIDYALANPGRVAVLAVRKLARFWNPVPNERRLRHPAAMAALGIPYLLVMLFACVGAGHAWRRPEAALTVILPVVYYSLLHLVFVSSVRYRIVVMPLLIALAGLGIARVREQRRRSRGADASAS
jgi:4-amino-4-deoxy-L-arabinose transferase-like glycosyltransferase